MLFCFVFSCKARFFFICWFTGESNPKFLIDPPENKIAIFLFFYVYLSTPHIYAVKYINFTCTFGEELLLFDWPKLFFMFLLLFCALDWHNFKIFP